MSTTSPMGVPTASVWPNLQAIRSTTPSIGDRSVSRSRCDRALNYPGFGRDDMGVGFVNGFRPRTEDQNFQLIFRFLQGNFSLLHGQFGFEHLLMGDLFPLVQRAQSLDDVSAFCRAIFASSIASRQLFCSSGRGNDCSNRSEAFRPSRMEIFSVKIRLGKLGIELHDRLSGFDRVAVLDENFQQPVPRLPGQAPRFYPAMPRTFPSRLWFPQLSCVGRALFGPTPRGLLPNPPRFWT